MGRVNECPEVDHLYPVVTVVSFATAFDAAYNAVTRVSAWTFAISKIRKLANHTFMSTGFPNLRSNSCSGTRVKTGLEATTRDTHLVKRQQDATSA